MQAIASWFGDGQSEQRHSSSSSGSAPGLRPKAPPPRKGVLDLTKGVLKNDGPTVVAVDSFGVGMVFEVNHADNSIRVAKIDMSCSAGRAGVIMVRNRIRPVFKFLGREYLSVRARLARVAMNRR